MLAAWISPCSNQHCFLSNITLQHSVFKIDHLFSHCSQFLRQCQCLNYLKTSKGLSVGDFDPLIFDTKCAYIFILLGHSFWHKFISFESILYHVTTFLCSFADQGAKAHSATSPPNLGLFGPFLNSVEMRISYGKHQGENCKIVIEKEEHAKPPRMARPWLAIPTTPHASLAGYKELPTLERRHPSTTI